MASAHDHSSGDASGIATDANTDPDASTSSGAARAAEPASARSMLTLRSAWTTVERSRKPFFPSDRLAPRRRRPADAWRLIAAGLAFVLLGWLASGEPSIDVRLLAAMSDLPDWMTSLAWFGYTATAVLAALLVIVSLAQGGVGRGLFRDFLAAVGLAVLLGIGGARLSTGAWPDILPEFVATEDVPPYPTMRPALVLIVALVLGTYVNARVQTLLRWMIALVILCPIVLQLTTITTLFGSLALSFLSVAAVRLIWGSPEGLPSVDRLASALDRVGITVTDLAYDDEQPGTVGLASARSTDGRMLDIKIYGVDAASQQRAERIWRSLWYRSAGPSPRTGRMQQAQHEALASLIARDAGVRVPQIVGAGQDADGDVLLVTLGAEGRAIADVSDLDDADLRSLWAELGRLHEDARIVHGGLDFQSIRLADGEPEFVDLANASMFPTTQQLATDMVSMLATQAAVVGVDRAVAAAVDVVERDALTLTLPYVQSAVLAPALRNELKEAGVKASELNEALAERLDVEPPELAEVRRVSGRDIAIAVAAIIAANALISQIADVGLDTILDELRGASWGWLVAAFLIKLAGYTTSYIGMKAVIEGQLPFLPTTLLQSAQSFVGLVVPSLVGRVGMEIRFLQNLGVPLAVASTQGPLIGAIGFVAEVVLLLLCAWTLGQEIESDGVTSISGGGLIAIAVIVVVVGIAVVVAVPKWREKVIPVVKQVVEAIKEVVTSPAKLGRIFGSEVLNRVIGAVSLAATIAAFGASLPFAAVVFVSVGTGLLAGIAPVPGGIGVAEATMSGLLAAVGIPTEQAVSIAIIHRVVTAYAPPILGFFSFNWLSKEGYI